MHVHGNEYFIILYPSFCCSAACRTFHRVSTVASLSPPNIYNPSGKVDFVARRRKCRFISIASRPATSHHTKNNMTSSKFVEILDTTDAPYSHDNVSLQDVLAETRERSASASSASSASSNNNSASDLSSSRERSPPRPNNNQPVKTRLRGFSLRKNKT